MRLSTTASRVKFPCSISTNHSGRGSRGLGAGADCGLLGGLGVTAGWGETEVPMDVSYRRLALVLHRHLSERGLLLFLRLLRAVQLHAIKAAQSSVLASRR